MSRLSKADRLDRYKARIHTSLRWREDEGYDDTWNRLIDMYRGRQFSDEHSQEDRICINVAFATLNIIYPSVSINHPKIAVSANLPDEEDKAVIVEAVVNYWWKHHDFRLPFRKAVKDSLIVGHGWLKVGYRFKEKDVALTEDERAEHMAQAHGQLGDFAAARPDLAGDLPSEEEVEANLPEVKSVVVEDRPFVERVSPFDVFVDPESEAPEDMTWIAQRIVRPLEDVRADRRYRESVRRRTQPDQQMAAEWLDSTSKAANDTDVQRVTIWEFYDIRRGEIAIFAEDGDDYLVAPQAMPYSFGHPFVFCPNYDVPEQFYPLGDLEMLEGPQHELNKTRSMMMNQRKKYARKWLYRDSAFSPDGRQALESDIDNTMVPVADDNQQLSDVILPMPITMIDPQAYNYSELVESDVDKVSGVSEYARGALPETKRTATEASIIQDGANARAADKLAGIEFVVAQVARRVVAIAQQFMTGEQVARITGGDAHMWVPFTAEDILGEFDFSVEGGSTQPMDETGRRQQALAMVNALAPFMGEIIDPRKMVQHVMQYGFGVKNAASFIVPPPPPEDQPPEEKLVLNISYKDAPPDVQRQMEQMAGMQPSQLGALPMPGMSPGGGPLPKPEKPVDGEGPVPQPQQPPVPQAPQTAPAGVDAPQMDPRMLLAAQQGA